MLIFYEEQISKLPVKHV